MPKQRLFVAQLVTGVEEQWLAPGTDGPPLKIERTYGLEQQLFAASDEHDAYRIVSSWLDSGGFSDADHDGDGDLRRFFGVGIHQLEEIRFLGDFASAVRDLYGVGLPEANFSDVDANGIPLVREMEELEVFRLLRLHGDGS